MSEGVPLVDHAFPVSAATCPIRPSVTAWTRSTDGAAAGLDEVSATGTLLPLPGRVRDRRRRPLGLGAKALAAIFAAVDTGASLFAGQPADGKGPVFFAWWGSGNHEVAVHGEESRLYA